MSGVQKAQPAIRFEGFSGDWVEKPLGNVADFSKGRGYSKSDLCKSGYPIVLYGRLYTNYQTVITDVDTFVSNDKDSLKSKGNEVVVPASGETSEDIARASVIKHSNIIIGGDLNIITLQAGYESSFTALSISHGKHQSELASKAQGKSVVHIRNSDLKELSLEFPTPTEQTAIGNFFKQLDDSIALHKRKHQQTQQLKKAMLTKLFPQKGQTQPEIRLQGFSGDWEEKRLGDVANIRRGASPRPIEDPKWFDKNSSVGWLRISDVTSQNGRVRHIQQKLSKLGEEETLVLTTPHLILSIAATVGKPVINYVPTGVHDGFVVFLGLTSDKEFLYQWLDNSISKWRKLGQPGSQLNLNSEIVKLQTCFFPSPKEQTAIGNFFKQLDDTLALQTQQINTLDNVKKAFLQKMFV